MTAIDHDRQSGRAGRRALDGALILWIAAGVVVAALFLLRGELPWLIKFPKQYVVPVGSWIDISLIWFSETFRWLFRAVAWVLVQPLLGLRVVLAWLPWPLTIAIVVVLSYFAGGRRLALFSLLSLLYMAVVGYWEKSMLTLSLVAIAVPLSVAIGLFIGILAFRYRAGAEGGRADARRDAGDAGLRLSGSRPCCCSG